MMIEFLRGAAVGKKKGRQGFDEFASRVRDLLQELDRLINPQPAKPVRVPVPVPVRPERRPRYDMPHQ
jgi:hypothetical protein